MRNMKEKETHLLGVGTTSVGSGTNFIVMKNLKVRFSVSGKTPSPALNLTPPRTVRLASVEKKIVKICFKWEMPLKGVEILAMLAM